MSITLPKPPARLKPASSSSPGNLPQANASKIDAPRTIEEVLGLQIRSLRKERDLSVCDLASAVKMSVGTISMIENGRISTSLSTIQLIAQALNTPLTALFSLLEEKRECFHVLKGSGVIIERRGTKVGHVSRLLGEALGGHVVIEPYLISFEDDAAPYTCLGHAGIEFLFILTGELVYRHRDRVYRLKPGDALLFDPRVLHGPLNMVQKTTAYLSIIAYPRAAS